MCRLADVRHLCQLPKCLDMSQLYIQRVSCSTAEGRRRDRTKYLLLDAFEGALMDASSGCEELTHRQVLENAGADDASDVIWLNEVCSKRSTCHTCDKPLRTDTIANTNHK